MNRIYQGRPNAMQVQTAEDQWSGISPDVRQSQLWAHHVLFQDAVNYYIVALASLGNSEGSNLSELGRLLEAVWAPFEKKGQQRAAMGESLKRTWNLQKTPSLAEALNCFRKPRKDDGVNPAAAEMAGEYLLFKLGGDSAIQQGGRTFFPMFCDPESQVTFNLSAARRGRADAEQLLQTELHRDLANDDILRLAKSISLGSVVNLQPGAEPDTGEAVIARLKAAAATFADEVPSEEVQGWLKSLKGDFSLPKRRGGNINVRRVDACALFLAFPNQQTKRIFQSTFSAQRAAKGGKFGARPDENDESRFMVDGDDPIKVARGKRGFVFPAFTALPIWHGNGSIPAWKEFDIAAFKEALKVYNQFKQNRANREAKLDGFATRVLIMDGERAIQEYSSDSDRPTHARLRRVWEESGGKPRVPQAEQGESTTIPTFVGDFRIARLRQIVNDDLAEEYRLTDGRRTPYGLRRRTMKGWPDVKRKWQGIVKAGEAFSIDQKKKLKQALDEMRGGEKREQIGSHKLFEEMLQDEAGWSIWREPTEGERAEIEKKGWAAEPLEAFREYCELREALEDISSRPLNFTPADPRYSRRLFMFTDVCSFGKRTGEYRHDLKELAVIVPIATQDDKGRYIVRGVRLQYSAPRLLRDRIRAEDGTYAQDWTQPMMRALLGEDATNPQALEDAAVQLMPDFDASGKLRFLLNFPLQLDETALKKKLGKEALWERQFVSWKNGDQFPFLRWHEDFDGKQPHVWWEKACEFRTLAADLGTRHAASIAIIECAPRKESGARQIGVAAGKPWFARYRRGKILRLPGEDARVLRPETPLDKDGKGKDFRQELFGDRGRRADEKESAETFRILELLQQGDLLKDFPDAKTLQSRLSFPEQNDKLLVGLRRGQNWIASCVSWHWKLTNPENDKQQQAAIEAIKEQEKMPQWRAFVPDGSSPDLIGLQRALELYISAQRAEVSTQLLALTRRILPLRDRDWEWVAHHEKADCHLLRQTAPGPRKENVKLRGQRGLSMARIEQLSELRRRGQSLNQSLRRKLGQRPLTAAEMRNDPIPDPCPDILRKLENIREQRVNQTAHMILAEALGLELAEPELGAKRREATDTHGEYKVARPPVDMIVLEDLSRYLSDQGRAKSENTRLMKWCHRAVVEKLKMLAEPFGIPVLETPAAYSSRFCSLSGIVGFRATQVALEDQKKFRWSALLKEYAEAEREGKTPSEMAAFARKLFKELERLNGPGKPNRTLFAPQAGGPWFVTMHDVPHPNPSPKRKNNRDKSVRPMQADLNAAINLALRAVAHPGCSEIHQRLRTERKKGAKSQPDAFFAREPRRFGKTRVGIEVRPEDSLPKERNPNLFFDPHGVAQFGRARLETDAPKTFPFASGPGLWKVANDRVIQWERCAELNRRITASWDELEDNVPM